MAAPAEVWTVFARSNAGIMGLNLTQGMDVCVCFYSLFVLSFVEVAALRRAVPPSKESYHLRTNEETEEEARAQQRAIESLMNEWKINTSFGVEKGAELFQ
jgi:hypothetical protein